MFFQQFPAQVRVTTRFLLAMAVCCFFLQSLEGTRVAFEVTNAEITLGELQKDVLMLFEKDISVTWVSLVWESVTYAKPDSQPFVEASEGDVLNAVFETGRSLHEVEVRFRAGPHEVTMTVKKTDSLREVQRELCKAFHQRFPLMAASVGRAGTTYSDFNDLPFAVAEEGDEMQVTFEQTSDMWRPFACGFLP